MGLFDTVGPENIQIKSTPEPSLIHYKYGDDISLPDGLHLGVGDGWFVVSVGKVLMSGPMSNIYDKWGGSITHLSYPFF